MVFGEGATAPYNMTLEDTPWFTEKGALPDYDPAAAQALIDEYRAENGGGEITTDAGPRAGALLHVEQQVLQQLLQVQQPGRRQAPRSGPRAQARVLTDEAQRKALHDQVWEIRAEGVPYYPYVKPVNGFVTSPELKGGQVYEDGILRFDLLWKSA